MKEKSYKWSIDFKAEKRHLYINKYFNIFMNFYKFSGDIDYQQIDFILRKFWRDGCVAMFPLTAKVKDEKLPVKSKEHPNGIPVFTQFQPNGWNIYDFPTSVNLVNSKGVKFIPSTPQVVDKDVVIGYIQRNKKGVADFVENIVEDIVACEMLIYLNLNAHKMPWLIAVDPDSEKKMKELFRKIMNDDSELYISAEDVNNIKILLSGAPFIIDKLYNYKMARENEIREYFGHNNVGVGEKKEHLISAEVEANNEIVESSSGCLIDPMKEFFERGREVFGFDIKVEIRENNQVQYNAEQEEEVEDESQDQE